jgi:hypothetical protein
MNIQKNQPYDIKICDNGLSTLKLWKTKHLPTNIHIIRNSNVDKGGEDHYLSDDQTSCSHLEEKESMLHNYLALQK